MKFNILSSLFNIIREEKKKNCKKKFRKSKYTEMTIPNYFVGIEIITNSGDV